MSLAPTQFRTFSIIAARQADDKKADDISVLDLRAVPGSLADYMVLASANSEPHMNALRDSIEDALEAMGLLRLHRDGASSSQWTVLDFGGLLVHIFREEARSFYALERLWPDAKHIAWEPSAPLKTAHAKPVPVKKKKPVVKQKPRPKTKRKTRRK